MQSPPDVRVSSEFHDIGKVDHIRVNFGSADGCTVQSCFGVDVHPAQVCTKSRFFVQFIINTDLNREAKAVVKFKRAKGRLFLEECGVVHTGTDIGLERRVCPEVVVQRQGGRQLLGDAGMSDTGDADIVFERSRSQQFDAKVVPDEIFSGKGWPQVAADVGGAAGERAIAGFWHDRTKAEANGNVSLRLRHGACCTDTGKQEGGEGVFHLTIPDSSYSPNLCCGAVSQYDLDQSLSGFYFTEQQFARNFAVAA